MVLNKPIFFSQVDVWTGQGSGYIGIHRASALGISEVERINHYDPVVEGVEVYRLVTSSSDGTFVWSYVYPGTL